MGSSELITLCRVCGSYGVNKEGYCNLHLGQPTEQGWKDAWKTPKVCNKHLAVQLALEKAKEISGECQHWSEIAGNSHYWPLCVTCASMLYNAGQRDVWEKVMFLVSVRDDLTWLRNLAEKRYQELRGGGIK